MDYPHERRGTISRLRAYYSDFVWEKFSRRESAARAFLIVFLLLISFVMLFLFVRVASHYPKTADQINYYFASRDFANGNWRLRHWSMTETNFLTSDVFLMGALIKIHEAFREGSIIPSLLVWQPAIMWWTLVVTASGVLFSFARERKARAGGIAVIGATLAVPLMSGEIMYFITLSAIHVGTVIYGLVALACAAFALDATTRAKAIISCSGMFLTLLFGVFGDPLLLYTGVLPVLIASLMARNCDWRNRLIVAFVGGLAGIAARGLVLLNTATGGFIMVSPPIQFARFSSIGTNFSVSLHSVIIWFSADFFGDKAFRALPALLHLPLLIAAVGGCAYVLWRACSAQLGTGRQIVGADRRASALRLLLAFGAAINFAALFLSDRVAHEGNSIAAARYLLPLWAYLALFLALDKRWSWRLAPVAVVAMIATAGSNWSLYTGRGNGPIPQRSQQLVASLLAHNLKFGLASYWDSGVIEFASRGDVSAAYVAAAPSGQIEHYAQIHQVDELPNLHKMTFFVVVPNPAETFTEKDIVKNFGMPNDHYTVGTYTVLIYRR